MKKILLITNIPSPYRVDLYYYLQMNLKQYEIHVMYCAREADNRYWNIEKEKMINTHFLESKIVPIRSKYDTNHIFFPKSTYNELSKINPDVVIAWEYNPTAINSLIWCKLHRKKYISLTDGTLYSERKINYIQKFNRWLICRECNAAIASSSKAKEKLRAWRIPEKKIFVSLLTINIKNLCKIDRNPQKGRLLYVGSMVERKGLDLLISALRYVECEYCLHIVGNGTEEEIKRLKTIAYNANVINKIEFCGFLQGDELAKEYQEAEVFVFPTREDCFGLVLLEALCARIPIVSSKYADGAYDIVKEDENGVLVDPYDSQKFGEVINEVLSGTYTLNPMGDVDRFSFESVSKGYKSAIDYVLEN